MDEYRNSRVETSTAAESERQGVRRVVSVIISLLAILLLLRIVFMVLGANESNGFVNLIYVLTGWMVMPFRNIFPDMTFTALNQNGTFEPGAVIALAVVLLVGWLIQRLIAPNRPETTRVHSVDDVAQADRVNRPVDVDPRDRTNRTEHVDRVDHVEREVRTEQERRDR